MVLAGPPGVGKTSLGESVARALGRNFVRVALGGVAHRPWRDPQAEAALRGRPANAEAFAQAADVLLRAARSHEHNAFKIELARRCIVRALTQAARGTPQSQSSKKIA